MIDRDHDALDDLLSRLRQTDELGALILGVGCDGDVAEPFELLDLSSDGRRIDPEKISEITHARRRAVRTKLEEQRRTGSIESNARIL